MTRYDSAQLRLLLLAMAVAAPAMRGARAGETADAARPAPPAALVHAHSHNDYYRPRPLRDALERGFASIEADVFLVDGQLLVGHYRSELRPERSLAALYLDPLRELVARHGGRVFAGDERLTLLVDFKTEGAPTYAALAKLLAEYDGILSALRDGVWTPQAVDVVISGDRPIEAVAADSRRRAALDGRFADAPAEAPAHLFPLISEDWGDHFAWRGTGSMPADQRARLRGLVERAHGQGRRLRFWGAPDSPAVWQEQRAAGVDLLGADDLSELQEFLAGTGSETAAAP